MLSRRNLFARLAGALAAVPLGKETWRLDPLRDVLISDTGRCVTKLQALSEGLIVELPPAHLVAGQTFTFWLR